MRTINGMMLMPAAPGTCPECAAVHDPAQPHNQQSLYYRYRFYADHGRWPTWADAMAHCDAETRKVWRTELEKRGIDVDGKSKAASCN